MMRAARVLLPAAGAGPRQHALARVKTRLMLMMTGLRMQQRMRRCVLQITAELLALHLLTYVPHLLYCWFMCHVFILPAGCSGRIVSSEHSLQLCMRVLCLLLLPL
jgi:hypothetical protein